MKTWKLSSAVSILLVFLPAFGLANCRSDEESVKTYDYRFVCLFLFVIALYSPLPSLADARNTETPIVLEGGKIISASDAKQLQQDKNAFFADCRSAFNYAKGHIPTAKLISYRHTYKKSASGVEVSLNKIDAFKLPETKARVIVFYSHGSTGWKSYKAAKAAIKSGYKNVLWLRGGLKEWVEAGHPIEY